jgi:heme a synthase
MKNYFLPAARTTLVLVYLVIVAGALVRMTGSGMGCPDWPKCFGYYIPPTDISELTWTQGREFQAGQVVIHQDALWVAQKDFTSGDSFEKEPWQAYSKHDYAHFNPVHTWIEYINRLFGALAGLATLIAAIFSFGYRRHKPSITILSWFAVFLMGFQAWLGATVVYSVLNPIRITLHMVVALLIVALLLFIIRKADERFTRILVQNRLLWILWVSVALSLLQIILGTQVRQFVDVQVKELGYEQMHLILADPSLAFYFHRSISLLVAAVTIALYLSAQKYTGLKMQVNAIAILVLLEILTGVAMYYLDFPFGSQALHLVLASLMIGVQFWMLLKVKSAVKSPVKDPSVKSIV